MRRMMRYVVPAGDTELEIVSMGFNNPVLSGAPGETIYIFVEENDELEPESIQLKFFETGEAVQGCYMGTVTDGKNGKHLYWANYYEGFEDGGLVRGEDDVSEVQVGG